MEIKHRAQAGSFESSDMLVLIEPAHTGAGRIIELKSPVILQFGNDIRAEINQVLDQYDIRDVRLICNDKGALSPTISARIETAVLRAMKDE